MVMNFQFSYDKPGLHQNIPLYKCKYTHSMEYRIYKLYKIPCLSILFSEKANEQQPKQQETEENQYNPVLNITDFLLEVNKIMIFETGI